MSSMPNKDNSNEVQIFEMNNEKQIHATAVIDHNVIISDGRIAETTPLSIKK